MQRRFSPNDARQAGRHLMAGVVRWKMTFCEQQYHSGRRSAEIARDSLPLTSNSYKCHCSLHIGHLGNYNSFICHSLKPELRPAKVRQYVTVKVHNKDDAESCSSEVASSASQRKERNQLRALECYFSKLNPEKDQKPHSLHQKNKQQNGSLSTNKAEANMAHDDDNLSNRSGTLAVHFKKRNTGTKNYLNTAVEDYKGYLIFDEKNFLEMQKEDQTSSFCLTNLLAAINIAVLLFEIASPVKNSDIENLSLPLMYGSKINTLILSGEWWRLLTPMCLHSGFLHIALGCWMLLTFGPRVCRAYGQMTFLLIYILGGVSGNLTSFVHTPELTVCGTGPVFALIGAWLVYQSQNKQVIDKEVSESIFRQAVIAAALSFLLSTFGRIDNWTHLGATISGLFFGYLTCPSVELDNAAKNGQKEAVALVRRQADACKSVAIFAISILALALFAFAYGMQVKILDIE